ncbi:MAG: tRNA (adenosine(37)-N6)-threonylcarbamoyltransferase complex ATPase subunit type 1 TsaE [Chloroflexota bacterium]
MSLEAPRQLAVRSGSPERTRDIGRLLARHLRGGDVVLLHGDLGAGKTTLTQGIGAGLLVSGAVQSPTFILIDEHEPAPGGIGLHHVDLYRLDDARQLESLGFEEYLDPAGAVTVIEWPERAAGLLPETCLVATFACGDDARDLIFSARGDPAAAARWLDGLAREFESPE